MDMQPPRRPLFFEIALPSGDTEHEELLRGLRAPQASIAPKYFYDVLGSRLFEAICELPEYYLPRAEQEILDTHAAEIAEAVGPGCTLIDLGAGNCEKAERLFDLLQPTQYVAVDISSAFLRLSLERLQLRHPQLEIVGVVQDFSRQLVLPAVIRESRRLFFYPGSSIGNFSPDEAREFLSRIQVLSGSDGKLILGVDLVKDRPVLEGAYDDALGVTAAFNRNILNNVNRILGSDFDVRQWNHVARFNAHQSRVELFLEAERKISASLPDGPRVFHAGERIHTENSYKAPRYAPLTMFAQSGISWFDSANRFAVTVL